MDFKRVVPNNLQVLTWTIKWEELRNVPSDFRARTLWRRSPPTRIDPRQETLFQTLLNRTKLNNSKIFTLNDLGTLSLKEKPGKAIGPSNDPPLAICSAREIMATDESTFIMSFSCLGQTAFAAHVAVLQRIININFFSKSTLGWDLLEIPKPGAEVEKMMWFKQFVPLLDLLLKPSKRNMFWQKTIFLAIFYLWEYFEKRSEFGRKPCD